MNEIEERWVVRADDQRRLDRRAEETGIAQDALMESAGSNAARWILGHLRPQRVAVLAGPGGNGGDALVVARRLHEAGVEVRTFSVTPLDAGSEATQRMARRLKDIGGDPVCIETGEEDRLTETLAWAESVVDGLFGSGLSRPLCGPPLQVVESLNTAGIETISLDLPSGLSSDRGTLLGAAVRADVTLAMAFLKPAHLLYPAADYCGNTTVIPVDYPEAVLRTVEPWGRVCEMAGIRCRLAERRPDGHKGTFGRVLVVAGSVGMTGAAVLCCRAALRAGAGLVSLAVPASLDPIVETMLPEVITIPLPDADGHVVPSDDPRLASALERADVLAIGPGLSRAQEALDAAGSLLERFSGPIVVDADALLALNSRPEVLLKLAGRAILTPHPGELSPLTGGTPDELDRDRHDAAVEFAVTHGCILVLKGRPTVIALPDGTVYFNPTGNDGLATGGSGDVLTGLMTGFIAGGASLEDAALAATYVHGFTAEVYARDRATRSLLPTDVIELLPIALWEIERCG